MIKAIRYHRLRLLTVYFGVFNDLSSRPKMFKFQSLSDSQKVSSPLGRARSVERSDVGGVGVEYMRSSGSGRVPLSQDGSLASGDDRSSRRVFDVGKLSTGHSNLAGHPASRVASSLPSVGLDAQRGQRNIDLDSILDDDEEDETESYRGFNHVTSLSTTQLASSLYPSEASYRVSSGRPPKPISTSLDQPRYSPRDTTGSTTGGRDLFNTQRSSGKRQDAYLPTGERPHQLDQTNEPRLHPHRSSAAPQPAALMSPRWDQALVHTAQTNQRPHISSLYYQDFILKEALITHRSRLWSKCAGYIRAFRRFYTARRVDKSREAKGDKHYRYVIYNTYTYIILVLNNTHVILSYGASAQSQRSFLKRWRRLCIAKKVHFIHCNRRIRLLSTSSAVVKSVNIPLASYELAPHRTVRRPSQVSWWHYTSIYTLCIH